MGSTEVVNHTSKAMKVKVGFNHVFRDLTTVEKDGVYRIAVDPNSTYQQFCMGEDAAGKPIIVDSDQLVDNMCITIAESDGGNFQVLKVPSKKVPEFQGIARSLMYYSFSRCCCLRFCRSPESQKASRSAH